MLMIHRRDLMFIHVNKVKDHSYPIQGHALFDRFIHEFFKSKMKSSVQQRNIQTVTVNNDTVLFK